MSRITRVAARGLVVAILASSASGAAAETLTLAEAMARARSGAREVDAARARAAAAEERGREARGHRLPRLSLQEVWLRTDSPAEAFALTLNQERFSFPDFVAGDPNDPQTVEAATTRLELSWALYAGGELASRKEQAELGAEAASAALGWAGDEAALAAAEAWVGLTRARDQVALLEESLAAMEAHLELARAYEEQGMLVSSERLRAEVERARLADMLSMARGMAEVAEAALSYRLGEPLDGAWETVPLEDAPRSPGSLAPWLDAAVERSDLEAGRLGVAAAELEHRARLAARLPRVGLVARGDLVDDAPFGSHGDSTTVMAVASIDLLAGGSHAAARAAAQLDAEAARSDLERYEEGVRLEVEQAWIEARSALERQATATDALVAAREMQRVVEERFRQGVVKTLDVVDAATARREAAHRELTARADAWLAALRLAARAGKTPESALPGASEEGS